jgi:hypothetical protein
MSGATPKRRSMPCAQPSHNTAHTRRSSEWEGSSQRCGPGVSRRRVQPAEELEVNPRTSVSLHDNEESISGNTASIREQPATPAGQNTQDAPARDFYCRPTLYSQSNRGDALLHWLTVPTLPGVAAGTTHPLSRCGRACPWWT